MHPCLEGSCGEGPQRGWPAGLEDCPAWWRVPPCPRVGRHRGLWWRQGAGGPGPVWGWRSAEPRHPWVCPVLARAALCTGALEMPGPVGGAQGEEGIWEGLTGREKRWARNEPQRARGLGPWESSLTGPVFFCPESALGGQTEWGGRCDGPSSCVWGLGPGQPPGRPSGPGEFTVFLPVCLCCVLGFVFFMARNLLSSELELFDVPQERQQGLGIQAVTGDRKLYSLRTNKL